MAYAKNKSPETLSEEQIRYIKEIVPNMEISEKPTAEEADTIYDIAADDLLRRGFDIYYELTEHGWLAESIMDFIEDNYPELFRRGKAQSLRK